MINEKYCKALELDKVLQMLANLTCCEQAYNLALNIKPSSEYNYVLNEIQKTDDALNLSIKYGRPQFLKISNPNDIIKRCLAGAVLNNKEFLLISKILSQAIILSDWYFQIKQEQNSLENLFSELSPNKYLKNKINNIIISEDKIDDSASDELFSIRRKITNKSLKIRENLEKIIKSPTQQKYLQENIITMRDGRYVVPVKSEYKSDIKGLVHDSSSTGATLFIEPMSVVEANNEIKILLQQEKSEIEKILSDLSKECSEFSDSIIESFDVSVLINLYFSKSELALKLGCNKPKICNNGKINLIKAKHPLIEKDKVVSIDIKLGEDYNSLVVTGPNTGGKTVTLKTLGLLTLMTMCGLLIPVEFNSQISIFDDVLVDIGDEQSIEYNLSTFSSHMTNIISIIDIANSNSLVLLDELGSGTDPVEGAGLAISILENLKNKGCKIVSTTHYTELKMYALKTKNVENACCEFDIETLKPTYKLLVGVTGRSNAFAISEKLGLPKEILTYARNLISNEDKTFEDVIENLEKARQKLQIELNEISKKNKEIEIEKQEISNFKKDLEKNKEKLIQQSLEKAKKIVDEVKKEAENIIVELDEVRKNKSSEDFNNMAIQVKAKISGKFNSLENKINPIKEKKATGYKLPRPLKKGDSVLIIDIDKKAIVLSPVDNSGKVYVQAGIIKSRVKLDNLKLLEEKNSYSLNNTVVKTNRNISNRTAKMDLDLRGQNVEEALMDLDLFIDNAVLSNINLINIVHGKGTGVLRKAVHIHLKKHKNIRSFRLGAYGEGEDGVTIAEIK